MGTNFYLRKRLSQEDKDKAKSFIDNDDYTSLKELIPEDIHIGKRSGGWKFLWNAHYFEYFEPNLQSLYNWLQSGDIYDEYGNKYTFAQFITEELKGFITKGYDLESYYEENTTSATPFDYFNSIIDKFKRKCPNFKIHINKYGEFYIEGLRFTVSEDFS